MKVVINKCFGRFGLSDSAIYRYAEIKGLTLYPEKGDFDHVTYYLRPKEARSKEIDWASATIEERRAYNEASESESLYDRDIDRTDPALVLVVEELGAAASGRFAQLAVVSIPDGIDWEIDDYDGNERIAEKHQTWG